LANGLARRLRSDATPAERRLWRHIRYRQIAGHRFRRQHPFGPYVLDFVCLEKRLVVEVDGGQHSEAHVERHDELRSAWLSKEGYRVVRFWNNEVLGNLAGVVAVLQEELEK